MLIERIEARWIDAFANTLGLCGVAAGDEVAVLSETQSRAVLPRLAELALLRMGARPFHVVMPSPPVQGTIPVRSTGTSLALGGNRAAIASLAASRLVVDCTVEGLLHAPERGAIMAGGARRSASPPRTSTGNRRLAGSATGSIWLRARSTAR